MGSFWWYITLMGPDGYEDALMSAADIAGSCGSEVQELPSGVRIRYYFLSSHDLGYWQGRLLDALRDIPGIVVEDSGKLENQPWYKVCEEGFTPVEAGRSFVITAPWHADSYEGDRVPIIIKPGSAFGTGYHESTRIALELMERACDSLGRGFSALDVGTGSGILAIGALKLGASRVFARDLDGTVASELEENLSLNQLEGQVSFEEGDLLKGFSQKVDLVTANILKDPLLTMLPQVGEVLTDRGLCVFSGLLAAERDEFMEALRENGMDVLAEMTQGDWWGVLASPKA
ncbi:ribosomal protein L11 methylase [Thermanaerovibrio velox DSM 12556]|uniref:Ribosomal protein L11 methyltransferase n=1 Tax=Thermanaerovibrio velox DSM 12556 TaxID=926567 RepID=H0USK9_9BACT|nr:50S ribosomal protein L11 methyltransferase [Thermanaerovibrio velox]EHM10298.1 ribosomal protein L11 methylase [Thermanaerovibrio velox DSM 12556]